MQAVGSPAGVGAGVIVQVGVAVGRGVTGLVHPQKRMNAQTRHMMRNNLNFSFMVQEIFFNYIKAPVPVTGSLQSINTGFPDKQFPKQAKI